MTGLIIKNISNDYTVQCDNNEYICKPRGKLRINNQVPLVGDIVEFDPNNKYILSIHKRKNELIRPSIANVDCAIITTSVKHPDFDSILLDKQLTIISFNNIEPIIYITKLDLLNDLEKEKILNILAYYQNIGYKVIFNKDDLLKEIENKTVVLTGQSGAGKSTLLNKIDPTLNLQTNEISLALGRGKHTTRHTELFQTNNTRIADTPGFSKIDFIDLTNIDIRDNMKEMYDNLEFCKYHDCMHITEDGCQVKKILNEGKILESRYNNYRSFITRKEK